MTLRLGDTLIAGSGANTNLSNLTSQGQNIANWSSNVTNCITEIPQDIKLELNNGTLTLKAGSTYYKCDGSFTKATTSQDYSTTNVSNGVRIVFFTGSGFDIPTIQDCNSGTSEPTTGNKWFNTSNKILYSGGSGNWQQRTNYSLPLAIITISNGTIISIDQVFNGFGYIGDAIFTLPNVKLLISNKFNNDGTLNNIIVTNNIVRVNTWGDGSGNRSFYLYADSNFNFNRSFTENYFEQDEAPTPQNNLTWWRSNKYNITQKATSGVFGGNWIKLLEYTRANNRITSLTHNPPFHALDYNDSSTISGWSMPSSRYDDLTLGASGTDYAAPANGWFSISKVAGASDKYISLTNGKFGIQSHSVAGSDYLNVYIPAEKGDSVNVSYNVTGNTNYFRFFYAEGENV